MLETFTHDYYSMRLICPLDAVYLVILSFVFYEFALVIALIA